MSKFTQKRTFPLQPDTPQLTLIQDGHQELARKQWLLFNQPWQLSLDEFDALAKACGLTRAEEFDLMLFRLHHKARHNIEARFLLAVLEGRKSEADRLGKILERRNALGLKVIASRTAPKPEGDADET